MQKFTSPYNHSPQAFVLWNRLANCPDFGDTSNTISIKFIYLNDKQNQIIRLPYRQINITFQQLLRQYKKQVQYVQNNKTELIIKNKKTDGILNLNEKLLYYKDLIQDHSTCHFIIIQRQIIPSQKVLPQNIANILNQKQYKQQRFYSQEEKINVIIAIQGKKIELKAYKNQNILELKCDICKHFQLDLIQFSIIYAGKPLNNQNSILNDLNITSGSQILVIRKILGGCFSKDTRIRVGLQEQRFIEDLQNGGSILSYNQQKGVVQRDKIKGIHKTRLQIALRILLQNGENILCSPTHKFYTKNGWLNYEYDIQSMNRLKIGDRILNYKNEWIQIMNIGLQNISGNRQYYHLSVDNNHTFIINNMITHNMQIKILYNEDGKIYFINTKQTDTIFDIKQKIEKILNIPHYQQLLLLGSNVLKNQQSISDYIVDFKNTILRLMKKAEETIVVYNCRKKKQYQFNMFRKQDIAQLIDMIHQQLFIQPRFQILSVGGKILQKDKKLSDYPIKQNYNRINLVIVQNQNIKTSLENELSKKILKVNIRQNESVQLNYSYARNLKVNQLISSIIPNSRPNYSLMFGRYLLHPQQKIKQIEIKISCFEVIQCRLIINYDKIIYINLMLNSKQRLDENKMNFITQNQKMNINNNSQNIKKQLIKIVDNKYLLQYKISMDDIVRSIQYYTCRGTLKQLDNYLSVLYKLNEQQCKKQLLFNYCSVLTRTLLSLPTYLGKVYRIINSISLCQYYKQQDFFYISSFLSTNKQKPNKPQYLQKYTVINIISLTGRPIQKFTNNQQGQIVFLPFTYFFVQKIQKYQDYNEIWLSQVPSPLTFTKNIILWVDDQPNNNTIIIKDYNIKLQIIQLLKTKIAQKWILQFGWILRYKSINIKIISDMVRYQKLNHYFQPGQPSYCAGIDLLELFHNQYGFSTPIMIYCGDQKKAKQNIVARKITNNRISVVTAQGAQIHKFLKSI